MYSAIVHEGCRDKYVCKGIQKREPRAKSMFEPIMKCRIVVEYIY